MSNQPLIGTILDDQDDLSLNELARICSCEAGWIVELVEEGVLEPRGQGSSEWRFTGVSLIRVRTALRLHRDLNLNLAGIALAMDLLEEINELKSRLGVLETQA